jgi:hypothetical protein
MYDNDEDTDKWFLLVRNHNTGETQVRTYGEGELAVAEYDAAEHQFTARTKGKLAEIEVVLILADSEDAVRAAYPHYFAPGRDAVDDRDGVRNYLRSSLDGRRLASA